MPLTSAYAPPHAFGSEARLGLRRTGPSPGRFFLCPGRLTHGCAQFPTAVGMGWPRCPWAQLVRWRRATATVAEPSQVAVAEQFLDTDDIQRVVLEDLACTLPPTRRESSTRRRHTRGGHPCASAGKGECSRRELLARAGA